MSEGRTATPPGDAPPVRLPEPAGLFEARAARLAALAPGHALPDWLRLVSRIAAGQAVAVREIRPVRPALPAGAACPLAVQALPRDDAWRRQLRVVVGVARGPGLPAATQEILRFLEGAGPAELEPLADALLAGLAPASADGAPPRGGLPRARLAAAPFVGAALQAWLSTLAAGLAPADVLAPAAGTCPVCGGPPVAGRIRRIDRRRDVTCALCATEWNVPRVRCAVCDTSAGPGYYELEGERGLKAEACPTCHRYLKLVDEEQRAGADPAADDAATLTVDLLLAEEGFHRAGPNLYVGG